MPRAYIEEATYTTNDVERRLQDRGLVLVVALQAYKLLHDGKRYVGLGDAKKQRFLCLVAPAGPQQQGLAGSPAPQETELIKAKFAKPSFSNSQSDFTMTRRWPLRLLADVYCQLTEGSGFAVASNVVVTLRFANDKRGFVFLSREPQLAQPFLQTLLAMCERRTGRLPIHNVPLHQAAPSAPPCPDAQGGTTPDFLHPSVDRTPLPQAHAPGSPWAEPETVGSHQLPSSMLSNLPSVMQEHQAALSQLRGDGRYPSSPGPTPAQSAAGGGAAHNSRNRQGAASTSSSSEPACAPLTAPLPPAQVAALVRRLWEMVGELSELQAWQREQPLGGGQALWEKEQDLRERLKRKRLRLKYAISAAMDAQQDLDGADGVPGLAEQIEIMETVARVLAGDQASSHNSTQPSSSSSSRPPPAVLRSPLPIPPPPPAAKRHSMHNQGTLPTSQTPYPASSKHVKAEFASPSPYQGRDAQWPQACTEPPLQAVRAMQAALRSSHVPVRPEAPKPTPPVSIAPTTATAVANATALASSPVVVQATAAPVVSSATPAANGSATQTTRVLPSSAVCINAAPASSASATAAKNACPLDAVRALRTQLAPSPSCAATAPAADGPDRYTYSWIPDTYARIDAASPLESVRAVHASVSTFPSAEGASSDADAGALCWGLETARGSSAAPPARAPPRRSTTEPPLEAVRLVHAQLGPAAAASPSLQPTPAPALQAVRAFAAQWRAAPEKTARFHAHVEAVRAVQAASHAPQAGAERAGGVGQEGTVATLARTVTMPVAGPCEVAGVSSAMGPQAGERMRSTSMDMPAASTSATTAWQTFDDLPSQWTPFQPTSCASLDPFDAAVPQSQDAGLRHPLSGAAASAVEGAALSGAAVCLPSGLVLATEAGMLKLDADSPTVLGSCSICWEKPVEAVFLECGHAASCMECAMPLEECPICRGKISRVVRLYAT